MLKVPTPEQEIEYIYTAGPSTSWKFFKKNFKSLPYSGKSGLAVVTDFQIEVWYSHCTISWGWWNSALKIKSLASLKTEYFCPTLALVQCKCTLTKQYLYFSVKSLGNDISIIIDSQICKRSWKCEKVKNSHSKILKFMMWRKHMNYCIEDLYFGPFRDDIYVDYAMTEPKTRPAKQIYVQCVIALNIGLPLIKLLV